MCLSVVEPHGHQHVQVVFSGIGVPSGGKIKNSRLLLAFLILLGHGVQFLMVYLPGFESIEDADNGVARCVFKGVQCFLEAFLQDSCVIQYSINIPSILAPA